MDFSYLHRNLKPSPFFDLLQTPRTIIFGFDETRLKIIIVPIIFETIPSISSFTHSTVSFVYDEIYYEFLID